MCVCAYKAERARMQGQKRLKTVQFTVYPELSQLLVYIKRTALHTGVEFLFFC